MKGSALNILVSFSIILVFCSTSFAQESRSMIGISAGLSSTISYWEGSKPEKYDISLQAVSQASPSISIDFNKKILSRFWMSLSVKAQPVSWKYSVYYSDLQYNKLRRTKRLRTVGVWQFPLLVSYQLSEGISKRGKQKNLFIYSGIITSVRSAKADLNLGSLQIINQARIQDQYFDNGKIVNILIPVGIKKWIDFKPGSRNKLSLGICGVVGTRTAFREYLTSEEIFVIRSNGSYLEFSIGYLFAM